MKFTNNTKSEITLNAIYQTDGKDDEGKDIKVDNIETVVIPAGEEVEQGVYSEFKDNLYVKEGLVTIEGNPKKLETKEPTKTK
ncbi:hypothetical protein [Vibrio phage vB_VpM-pA2SJ1]|uniref:Uncharacterized protein n=1 Tax=Vibrio phage vB_VpM-pA2SJ1 TaxID=3095964 RepID=A0AAX4J5X9_9CAUD